MSQAPASSAPKRQPSRIKDALLFGLGLVLFALVLRWLAPDWNELATRVELDWRWALLGLLGTTLASFATAARWQLLAELMGGTKLPFSVYFHGLVATRLIGQFTSTMVMDLVGRGAALQAAGSERSIAHATMQVVLERLFDALLPVLLLGWAFGVRGQWFPFAPGLSLLLVCAVFTVVAIPLLGPCTRIALSVFAWLRPKLGAFRRWLAAKLRRAKTDAPAPSSETSQSAAIDMPTVSLGIATKVAAYSLARFATVVLQFWGIANAVGLGLRWFEISAATPIAQLAGMLGLTPGGLGILEAGWAGGLGWVGLDAVAISLFVLAQRLGVIANFGLLTALSSLLRLARRGAADEEASHAR